MVGFIEGGVCGCGHCARRFDQFEAIRWDQLIFLGLHDRSEWISEGMASSPEGLSGKLSSA